MKYTPRGEDEGKSQGDLLYDALEPVAKGLGMAILELSTFMSKARGRSAGSVQVKVTVYKAGQNMGVNDCSQFHKAVVPRLELAFPGKDLYLEVSSPGIGRLIKDGNEMRHFIGRGLKCYAAAADNADSGGWIGGTLLSANEKEITLETGEGIIVLPYQAIAKAKLDDGNL